MICAGLLSSLQLTILAGIPWAPDLVLALCAWIVVQGGVDFALVRVWLVLAIHDATDPASAFFHALGGLLLILPSLFAQERLQGLGKGAWFVWGAVWFIAFDIMDIWAAGGQGFGFWSLIFGALFTGLATYPLGLVLACLPRSLRPVPPPKDPTWATLSTRS